MCARAFVIYRCTWYNACQSVRYICTHLWSEPCFVTVERVLLLLQLKYCMSYVWSTCVRRVREIRKSTHSRRGRKVDRKSQYILDWFVIADPIAENGDHYKLFEINLLGKNRNFSYSERTRIVLLVTVCSCCGNFIQFETIGGGLFSNANVSK